MTGIVRSEGEAGTGRKVIIMKKVKKGDRRERGRAKVEEVRVGRKQGKTYLSNDPSYLNVNPGQVL